MLLFDDYLSLYEESKLYDKDHIATPKNIVLDIFNLINIKDYHCIWFPFDNYDSYFKLVADEMRLNYVATHKLDSNGNDFFFTNPPLNCDLLISNPPFSIQYDILERTFSLVDKGLIKSFVYLLPLSTLETSKRSLLYNKHIDKLKVVIFKNRIKFIGCDNCFNTACCLICYNISSIRNTISWI